MHQAACTERHAPSGVPNGVSHVVLSGVPNSVPHVVPSSMSGHSPTHACATLPSWFLSVNRWPSAFGHATQGSHDITPLPCLPPKPKVLIE